MDVDLQKNYTDFFHTFFIDGPPTPNIIASLYTFLHQHKEDEPYLDEIWRNWKRTPTLKIQSIEKIIDERLSETIKKISKQEDLDEISIKKFKDQVEVFFFHWKQSPDNLYFPQDIAYLLLQAHLKEVFLNGIYESFEAEHLVGWGHFLSMRLEDQRDIEKSLLELLNDPVLFLPVVKQDKQLASSVIDGFLANKKIDNRSILENLEGLYPEGEIYLYYLLSFHHEKLGESWLKNYCSRDYLNSAWIQTILDVAKEKNFLSPELFICIQKRLLPFPKIQKEKKHKSHLLQQFKVFFDTKPSIPKAHQFLCDTFTLQILLDQKAKNNIDELLQNIPELQNLFQNICGSCPEMKTIFHDKIQKVVSDFLYILDAQDLDAQAQRDYLKHIILPDIATEHKWLEVLIKFYQEAFITVWERTAIINIKEVRSKYSCTYFSLAQLTSESKLEGSMSTILDDIVLVSKESFPFSFANASAWEKALLCAFWLETSRCFSKTNGQSLSVVLRRHFQSGKNLTAWSILTHPVWNHPDWKFDLWEQRWTRSNSQYNGDDLIQRAEKEKDKFIFLLSSEYQKKVNEYLECWKKYWASEKTNDDRVIAPDSERFKKRFFRFSFRRYFQEISEEELNNLEFLNENEEILEILEKNYQTELFRKKYSSQTISWTKPRKIKNSEENDDQLAKIYEKLHSFRFFLHYTQKSCSYSFEFRSLDSEDEIYAEVDELQKIFRKLVDGNKNISSVKVVYSKNDGFCQLQIIIVGDPQDQDKKLKDLFSRRVGNDLINLHSFIEPYFSQWRIVRFSKFGERETLQLVPWIAEIECPDDFLKIEYPKTIHILDFQI